MISLHRLMRKTEQVIYPGHLSGETEEDYQERSNKFLFSKRNRVFKANMVNPEGWEAMLLRNELPLDPITLDTEICNDSIS